MSGQSVWNLWWTKWQWNRIFSEYFRFPLPASCRSYKKGNRAKPCNVQKTFLFRKSGSIGQNGTFEVFERSQSCGTLSQMLKACLNIKIHHFKNCAPCSHGDERRDSGMWRCVVRHMFTVISEKSAASWGSRFLRDSGAMYESTSCPRALWPGMKFYTIKLHSILTSYLFPLYISGPRIKAAGPWCWPRTPSGAEVKERVQLYIYSSSGLLWLVLGRTLPLLYYSFLLHIWLLVNGFVTQCMTL